MFEKYATNRTMCKKNTRQIGIQSRIHTRLEHIKNLRQIRKNTVSVQHFVHEWCGVVCKKEWRFSVLQKTQIHFWPSCFRNDGRFPQYINLSLYIFIYILSLGNSYFLLHNAKFNNNYKSFWPQFMMLMDIQIKFWVSCFHKRFWNARVFIAIDL